MKKSVLGIDLGTSSVKILQKFEDGSVKKAKAGYEVISPSGWWEAICRALSELELNQVEGIGLSSQVGTYIVNGQDVISWNSGIGTEELEEIKKNYTPEIFLKEISMAHPGIISYPIPRLTHILNHYQAVQDVCQPKDFICEMLTGKRMTDPYSWRGLANLETKTYSEYFLDQIGFEKDKLPKMIDYTEMAGYTREVSLTGKYLPAGIPVYVGLNDYYAALLGMGIQKTGDMFDITGTSEHVGILENTVNLKTDMVSGPYLWENVHYGVTASSGSSLNFGKELYDLNEVDLERVMSHNPPVFLPYLNGERAPVWDSDARGMFFGINNGCTREDMAYAVMEGVIFSLFHIYECMGCPYATAIRVAGGAVVFPLLNRLKAEMFGIPVAILKENDSSALGAALIASVGAGWYKDLGTAVTDACKVVEILEPTGAYAQWLRKRFSVYKELYPAVKTQYKRLKEIRV